MLMRWKEELVPYRQALLSCSAISTVLIISTHTCRTTRVSIIFTYHHPTTLHTGPCVILIGPVDGVRHCEPEPKYLMNHMDWFIMDTLALRGEDMIAVYGRKQRKKK